MVFRQKDSYAGTHCTGRAKQRFLYKTDNYGIFSWPKGKICRAIGKTGGKSCGIAGERRPASADFWIQKVPIPAMPERKIGNSIET